MSVSAALALTAFVRTLGQTSAKPELTGVAHVALNVTDMQSELNFLNKLGFEKAFANERNGRVQFYFVKVNNREFI